MSKYIKPNHTCGECDSHSELPTTMRVKPKGFKIVAPEYKGNAVLNANKS